MKKIRVFLSLVAFLLAIGGAFATEYFTSSISAWEFIDHPGVDDDLCFYRGQVCDSNGTIACTIGTGPVLRENSNVSGTPSCGVDLKKNP